MEEEASNVVNAFASLGEKYKDNSYGTDHISLTSGSEDLCFQEKSSVSMLMMLDSSITIG